jgi:hypothetical protein
VLRISSSAKEVIQRLQEVQIDEELLAEEGATVLRERLLKQFQEQFTPVTGTHSLGMLQLLFTHSFP